MSNDQLELHQYMPCQLAELSNAIIRSVADLFDEWYDLTITEWKVMVTVAKHPGLSAVAVAESSGLDTVAVSRAVTKLMDAGRISREFGREDRRRSILRLSDEGRSLYEEVLPVALKLQSNLLEGLSDEERRVFAKAVKTLSARSQDFVHELKHSREPAIKPPISRPFRNNGLTLTRAGLGVMPTRRAS